MRIRKVSADVLEPAKRGTRPLSAREHRRIDLERKLERVVRRADADSQAAFRLDLDEGEKAPTVRQAFGRVRDRLGASGVNLFTRSGVLIVAKRPQRRGGGPTKAA